MRVLTLHVNGTVAVAPRDSSTALGGTVLRPQAPPGGPLGLLGVSPDDLSPDLSLQSLPPPRPVLPSSVAFLTYLLLSQAGDGIRPCPENGVSTSDLG